MAINKLPKQSYKSFQEFITKNWTGLEPTIRKTWEGDWIGADLYKRADDFISDLQNFGGVLPPIQKLYTPTELNIKGAEGYSQEYIFDVYGESFDIGLVCEGVPEAWLCQQEIPAHKDNLTIRIRHGVSADVDNLSATKRYAMLADVYKACLSKYRVRVVLDWEAVVNYKTHYSHEITICDYTDYFDPLTLVSMSSITMFRAMMRGLSRMHHQHENVSSVKFTDKWIKESKIQRTQDELIIPAIYSTHDSEWNIPNMLQLAGVAQTEA